MPLLGFLHGFRSDCDGTFGAVIDDFTTDEFQSWWIEKLDYPWPQPIADNAGALLGTLAKLYEQAEGQITLIAHSMGGLVARRAIIDGGHRYVRRLIMLGTPNFGAMTTAQFGLLGQPASSGVTGFFAQYLRTPSMRDLTRIPSLFADAVTRPVHTEYITIPGTYFHEHRAFWDRRNFEAANALFGGTVLAAELLSAMQPLFRVTMTRPHDGIVEDRSCSLFPAYSDHWSEKNPSLQSEDPREKTYAHVVSPRCDNLTHSALARTRGDRGLVDLLKELVLAPTLAGWLQTQHACAIRK